MKTKTLLLLLFLVSLQQGVATTFKSGGIEYTILDEGKNTCAITYVDRTLTGRLNVPNTVPYKLINYTVVKINDGAFAWCQELTVVTLPNTITEIGAGAFQGCSMTSINFPNSLTAIGDAAFEQCLELKSITLPNSLISIGNQAFWSCRKISSIKIPASVMTIGYGICGFCDGLKSINVSQDNPNYASFNNALLNKDLSILLQGPTGHKGTYTIPESVTTIDSYAFSGSGTELTSVSLPSSVSDIKGYAFYDCYGLTTITLPNSVKTIGEQAFAYCDALKEIILPNSITTIDTEVFSHCTALESVCIPNSVKSIGIKAFYHCSNLANIIIPNSVSTIGGGAFLSCTSLDNLILPNSVTTIGNGAFQSCKSLSSIDIPNSVVTIGTGAFSSCVCLNSISIPTSVTSIGARAFISCYNLKEITLPESITTIEESTFSSCTSLTKVCIPTTVTAIKTKAFNECEIRDILCYATEPPKCVFDCFNSSTIKSASLQVPAQSVDKYKRASVWSGFRNITKINSPEVEQIILDQTAGTMIEGETLQLTATILPPEASDYELYWSSSDDGVARVSQTGLVTAVGKGNATIAVSGFDITSGSDFNLEATCEIEVVESSSIEDILAEGVDSTFEVYDLTGLCISKTATAEDLKSLTPGIYIIRTSKETFKYIVR